jgi:hypothetical protein
MNSRKGQEEVIREMWRRPLIAATIQNKAASGHRGGFFRAEEIQDFQARQKSSPIISHSSNGPLGTKVPAFEEAASFLLSSVFLKLNCLHCATAMPARLRLN